MKILFVFKEKPHENKFVYSLRDALLEKKIDATCSVDDFWHNYETYDIIHFHWLIGHISLSGSEDVELFKKQVDAVRARCKIVVTCHDIKSHFENDIFLNNAYKYLFEHCDVMIHIGKHSYDHFLKQSDIKINHYIIPHHIYNNEYDFSIEKSVARNRLKIPLDAKVLLCFGLFRNNVERNLALNAWKKVDLPKKYLLAPRFFPVNKKYFAGFKQRVKAAYYRLRGVRFTNDFIPHDMVETYFCAADVLMIQKVATTNSGNLTLGFHAKKVVVGPNVGNIKEILEKTGNPVFDPNDIATVTKAMKDGFRLKETELPQNNYDYAMSNWNVSEIALQHVDVYQKII